MRPNVDCSCPPGCEDALRLKEVVVLVSPSFYHQRKQFYGSKDGKVLYRVIPLLFRWSALDAVQLKKLMRINEGCV